MSNVREAYAGAATVTAALLGEPAVAAAWERPSALADMRVGALAAHLAQQIHNVPLVLGPAPAGPAGAGPAGAGPVGAGPAGAGPAVAPPISLDEHYDRVLWRGRPLDDETNVAIRRAGETLAGAGPAVVAERAAAAAAGMVALLRAEPPDRVVHLPWTGWALTLDDLLVTRLMELAVHNDDLAVSVGLPTPDLPEPATDAALDLLVRLARRRHGPVALLRALSRAERAPETIAAI